MATPAPAKRVAPVTGSGKVCRGWKTRVAAPAVSQGASTETEVAPLVWATTGRERPRRPAAAGVRRAERARAAPSSAATSATAPSGTQMK